MSEQIPIRKIQFGSLFKIIFWSGMTFWLLLAILMVVIAFVSPDSITVNERQAETTMQALAPAPIFLIFGGLISALFSVIGAGLLRLFGWILPLGEIDLDR